MREQQAVATEPAPPTERAREAAAGLPGRVLALQRSAGNRAARRILSRLVSTAADWMTVVPDADAGAYAISKLKDGKQVIEYGTKPKPKPKKKKKSDPDPPPDPVPPRYTAMAKQYRPPTPTKKDPTPADRAAPSRRRPTSPRRPTTPG